MKPVLFLLVDAHTTRSENKTRNLSLFCNWPFCEGVRGGGGGEGEKYVLY